MYKNINLTLMYFLVSIFVCLSSCSNGKSSNNNIKMQLNDSIKYDTAVFGAGCFWCVETIFQRLIGVDSVISGYTGGNVINPTYEEVCSGNTGHAEVAQIIYDPLKISYEELCQIFFTIHNPTTLNKQGGDVGTQYRSVIYYMNDNQKVIAQKVLNELENAKIYEDPIVTEISKCSTFYPAEDYHQNYFNLNKNKNPYCQVVILPKLEKFLKTYKSKTK